MLNGENTIAELRELARKGKINAEDSAVILYGVVADMLENQHHINRTVEEKGEEVKEVVRTRVTEVKNDVEKNRKRLDTNPVIKLGAFIRDNPKKAVWLGFFLVAASNVWFIDAFRRSILMLLVPLGLPIEWVDALTTG
jgi:hypothetical protein